MCPPSPNTSGQLASVCRPTGQEPREGIERGKVATIEYEAKAAGGTRKMRVCTPPALSKDSEQPVFYSSNRRASVSLRSSPQFRAAQYAFALAIDLERTGLPPHRHPVLFFQFGGYSPRVRAGEASAELETAFFDHVAARIADRELGINRQAAVHQ